jgi:peptidoglycan/LPS O-acetylase OafA/YrhL
MGVQTNFSAIFIRPDRNEKVIDGFRAIAIIYVVGFHCLFLATQVMSPENYFQFVDQFLLVGIFHGDKGVDLFFVISGYLITRHLLNRYQDHGHIKYGQFMTNRLLRIMPLYVFVLILAISMADPKAGQWWANILFINNFFPYQEMLIPWSWSVTIEMQFYLLAPLLVVLMSHPAVRHPLIFILALLILSVVIRCIVLTQHPAVYSTTFPEMLLTKKEVGYEYWNSVYVNIYTRFGPLAMGMGLAQLMHTQQAMLRDIMNKPLINAGLTVLAVWLIFFVTSSRTILEMSGSSADFFYLVMAKSMFALGVSIIMLMSLLESGLFGKIFSKILSLKLWFPISQTSYAIYFFHLLLIGPSFNIIKGNEQVETLTAPEVVMIWALTVLLTFFLGILTFVFIEKPFLARKK